MRRASLLAVSLLVALAGHAAEPNKPLPWLGMGVRPFTDGTGQRLLHVERTVPRGPSDVAGIRPGDIITHIAGATLTFEDDLLRRARQMRIAAQRRTR